MDGMKPLDEATKAQLYEKLRRPDLWDQCHKYGWIVTFVGTIIIQIVVWSYSIGSFRQSVEDMRHDFGGRISRLEQQIDKLLER